MPIALVLPLLLASGHALQPPGQFHAGEPVARDGEPWLALRIGDGEAALVPARLQLSTVHDALLDDEGEASGVLVASAPGTPDPAILTYLRGPALAPGPVLAGYHHGMPPDAHQGAGLDLQAGHSFEFAGGHYRVGLQCGAADSTAPVDPALALAPLCDIVLEAPEGRRQILARMSAQLDANGEATALGDDAHPVLLFAGDLDRDDRLDLILDTTDHYNVQRPTLMLSSEAEGGAMVGEAATFQAVGC